jgi:SAM-dependent methyltransferase
MTIQSFDPVEFKIKQRNLWDAVAAGWRKHWPGFERSAQLVTDNLVEMAKVSSGHHVLDLATGIGEPAVTAAQRVGPAGRIVAIDQAPQMIAIAKERASELKLENVEFLEIDGEKLNLPANSFDAILCRWGLMYLPDLPGVLSSMHRLLVPGGRFSAAVWDVPPNVPSLSLAARVAREILQIPPPAPGVPSPFSLADSDALEEALRAAGFVNVRSQRLEIIWEFGSSEAYVDHTRDVGGNLNALLAEYPAERQSEVWRAIEETAQQYAGEDGRVRMLNQTICVVGER